MNLKRNLKWVKERKMGTRWTIETNKILHNRSFINRGAAKPLQKKFEAIDEFHLVPGVPRKGYHYWGYLYLGVPIGDIQSRRPGIPRLEVPTPGVPSQEVPKLGVPRPGVTRTVVTKPGDT